MERAVIFDLDGVLTESSECHFMAWKKVADKLGIRFDRKANDLIRGVSRRDSLLAITAGQIKLSEEEILRTMEEKNLIYHGLLVEEGEKLLIPGIMDFLHKFKSYKIKSAIASASRNARTVLNISGIDKGYFDVVVDGNDVTKSKPDPEIFLLASDKLGIAPSNCIVVEDAAAGIEAARSAGMFTFGVGPAELGNCDIRAERLSAESADMIYDFLRKN